MMPTDPADAGYLNIVPAMIDYAEGRIYRELDPLRIQVTDSTTVVSSGDRDFAVTNAAVSALPGSYIIVDNINVILTSTFGTQAGSRVQLTPVSREFMDIAYPSGTVATGVPAFWAMASDTAAILGPPPDLSYALEIIGVQHPTPLSAANSSTFLTQYIPDVFFAACMVFISGFMRDFGAQADNHQMSVGWETQFKTLFQSAQIEQMRAKYHSQAWTSDPPNPLVQRA
jgi:hypothetical protein